MISTLKKLQAKKAAQENNGGFTLIELLIVIVVLGILAAVVVFSLGGVAGTSAVAACEADGSSINTAMAALDASVPGATALLASGAATNDLAPGYLQTIPANATHYQFAISTDNKLLVGSSTAVVPSTNVAAASYTAWTAAAPAGWVVWNGSATCKTSGTANGATVNLVN